MAAEATKKLPNIPKGDWPGAWKIYQYSKQAVLRNWKVLLGLIALSIGVSILISGLFGGKESTFFSDLLANLASAAISLVATVVYFASVRGKTISFSDAFAKFEPILYLKYLAANIIMGILVALSFLAFIVPFFFVFPRLVMMPYLVIDKGLDPIEATIQSWNMMQGHIAKVWGIVGATIAMALLMFTIIGLPFALYFLFMYQVALVVLYEYIAKSRK